MGAASRARRLLEVVSRKDMPLAPLIAEKKELFTDYQELQHLMEALELSERLSPSHHYIMLLGSFSSGKSALINALLGNTEIRKIGKPPIDKKLTMVGHTANAFLPEGDRLAIQKVDNELLRDAYIFDTPGTGEVTNEPRSIYASFVLADIFVYVFYLHIGFRLDALPALHKLTKDFPSTPRCIVFTGLDGVSKNAYSPITSDADVNEREYEDTIRAIFHSLNEQNIDLRVPSERIFRVVALEGKPGFGIERLREFLFGRVP